MFENRYFSLSLSYRERNDKNEDDIDGLTGRDCFVPRNDIESTKLREG